MTEPSSARSPEDWMALANDAAQPDFLERYAATLDALEDSRTLRRELSGLVEKWNGAGQTDEAHLLRQILFHTPPIDDSDLVLRVASLTAQLESASAQLAGYHQADSKLLPK